MNKQFFHFGQTILLRELWQNRVWTARPSIVIKDTSELTVFYIPKPTVCVTHRAPDGSHATAANILRRDWILKTPEGAGYDRLKIIVPGKGYSVILFKNPVDGDLRIWYVNMEEPGRRTDFSYDCTDLFLDIIIEADLSKWRWEDEDELEEAVLAGLVSREKASAMYIEGRLLVDWLQSGKSPFNTWANWRPDPSWKVPVLPEGWDVIKS
jgi:predicted RNA-binding protein associated with RNAse of E/G family